MPRDYHNGDRIRIDATVGDDQSGNLRGETGKVYGVNPHFVSQAGVPMTNVQLDGGAVFAVPTKSLGNERKSKSNR